jgi:hypothetical protein
MKSPVVKRSVVVAGHKRNSGKQWSFTPAFPDKL